MTTTGQERGEFVPDSLLRVGQPPQTGTEAQGGVESVQECREGTWRAVRDRDGVGAVATAESGLHHGFAPDFLRGDDAQQRRGL
jgi:hypothetical protein